jgi:hypothetical protein
MNPRGVAVLTALPAAPTSPSHGKPADVCWRHLNSDPPCRSNIDPGRIAEFGISNCG